MRTLVFHHEKNLNRNNFESYLHFDFAFLNERNSIFRQRFGIWKKKKTILVSIPFENRSKIAILFASERCGKQLSSLLFSSRTGLLSHHLEIKNVKKIRENNLPVNFTTFVAFFIVSSIEIVDLKSRKIFYQNWNL